MTATEIEVGKRFRFRGLLLKCKHPNQKCSIESRAAPPTPQGVGLQFAWVPAFLEFPYTAQHVSCLAVERGPRHRLSMQMEGSRFKLCLSFAILDDNQTKRIYLNPTKSNQPSREEAKTSHGQKAASRAKSSPLSLRVVKSSEHCLICLKSPTTTPWIKRQERRNRLNNSGNNFITLVAGIYISTTKRTRS